MFKIGNIRPSIILSTSTFVFIKTEETSTSESRRRKYRVLNIGYPFLNCRHRTKLDSEMQFHFRTRFASHVSLRQVQTRDSMLDRAFRDLSRHTSNCISPRLSTITFLTRSRAQRSFDERATSDASVSMTGERYQWIFLYWPTTRNFQSL